MGIKISEIRTGKPRPIEEQAWRRHHVFVTHFDKRVSPTSGCQRRRRKAIERREAWA